MSDASDGLSTLSLPPEIVILIFEHAAASCKESACSISLVSSWARAVALKHLFSTLVIRGRGRISNLTPFPDAIGSLVRNLWIENVGANWRNAIPFFSVMPSLESIALPGFYMWALLEALKHNDKEDTDRPNNNRHFRCAQIWIIDEGPLQIWRMFQECNVGTAFLRGITHLRLHALGITTGIPALPCLTHLEFPARELYAHTFSLLDGVLMQSSMQKLVLTARKPRAGILPPYGLADFALTLVKDYVDGRRDRIPTTRIYINLAERDSKEVSVRQWKDEVAGNRSIWDKAIPFDAFLDRTFFAHFNFGAGIAASADGF